jgi:hypothetical protein
LVRIISNTLGASLSRLKASPDIKKLSKTEETPGYIPRNAKLLAWAIFLMFFIENGTLGILPKSAYFVYRNMRISDFIMYGLIVYSFFRAKEYYELFNSKSLNITKLLLLYLFLEFAGSALVYKYNPVELFFRLKFQWASFLIFPYMLLIKRKAFPYLVKIIFPFAVISNFLYILSALTGTAYLPDINIVKATFPGGFKIYRVYGGTFFGEIYFLGFIYFWITKKFRLRQVFIVTFFALPHILAFGRTAWLYFIFTICVMFLWNTFKNKDFKTILKQFVYAAILIVAISYAFKYIPQSSYLTGALESRIRQGEEDVRYKEGTLGTRLENTIALIDLWQNSNPLVGIGMHPLWVIRPVTERESIYYWGFSDIKWAGVLAAYGLIGFLLIVICQLYYGFLSLKILKLKKVKDIYIFFIILFLCRIIFNTFSYNILLIGLQGFSFITSFYVAVLVYEYENTEEKLNS